MASLFYCYERNDLLELLHRVVWHIICSGELHPSSSTYPRLFHLPLALANNQLKNRDYII